MGDSNGLDGRLTDDNERRQEIEDALQRLRLSEERYERLVEQTIDCIFLASPDGKYIDVNRAGCEMFRMARDEMLALNIPDILHPDEHSRILPTIQKLASGDVVDCGEWRYIRKDGTEFIGELRGKQMPDGTLQGILRDVTDKKTAEAALRESEMRWKTMTETLPNLVWTCQPDGACDWLSTQWEKYTGIPVDKLLGLNWADITIHPDDRERTLKCWNDACLGIADYDLEYRIRRHDGEYHWFKTRGVPIYDDDGNIVYWFGTCTDIEDIKQAEAAKLRSEATLRAFYDSSPVFLGITEVVGDDIFHIYDNPATCRFFGVAPNDTANKFAKKQLGADEAVVDKWLENYLKAESTGRPVHFEHQHQSPLGPRWLSVTVSVLGRSDSGRTRFCYVAEDITERVMALDTLRQSEERFRLLVQHSANIEWMTDGHGRYVEPQESFEKFTGLSYDEYVEDGGLSAVHPDDRERVATDWQAALETKEPFEIEYRLRDRDGEYRYICTRGTPVFDAEGQVREWVGYGEDITSRKESEEEKYRLLEAEAGARKEAETLNELARSLAGELDLAALVQRVTDAATSLTGAQFGAFFYNVLNHDGESYMLYTLSGVPRSAFEKFPMPRNTPIFDPTFRGEGVVRSDDITKDPRYGTMEPHHGMPKGHLPVHSYLAAPVISRSGEVLGGLFFGHEQVGVFTESDERMVVGLAAHAAVAMDNARLYAAAQKEIEQRQRAEEELRAARDVLEDTVAERTSELVVVARDLQAEVEERKLAEQRLRQLMTRLVNIQEEERRRIGRNIHDHLGQQLTGLRINLASLEAQTSDMNGLSDLAKKIQSLAQELDSSIDFVTWELVPGNITAVGLDAALRELTETWSRRFNISADFNFRGRRDVSLPDDVSANMYRIAQEALHNIVKHAQADHAGILFEITDDALRLIVEDNGVGFSPDEPKKDGTHSLGLISMSERAAALDGSFEIESSPGTGTTIYVRVPLPTSV